MRRPLKLAILSILFGILSTWLTAWLATAYLNSATQKLEYSTNNATPPQWLMGISRTPLTTVVWSRPLGNSDWFYILTPAGDMSMAQSHPPSWSRPSRVVIFDMLSNQLPAHDRPWQLLEVASGWPIRCLRGSWTESPGIDVFGRLWAQRFPSFALTQPQTQTITRGLPIPTRFAGASPLLPTVPIWPALLANIAIHAAAFACLFSATSALLTHLRRRLRQSKCLCPTCRYDRSGLAADATCPECGLASSA